jgi:putative ABC transport system substrate-binding protein
MARAFALGIPTFGYPEFFARSGGLFAYSRDQKETYYTIARLVKKVLNGDNPGDLPIEQPTRFNFIINLKTAKAFNINVPPMPIVRADEVIG